MQVLDRTNVVQMEIDFSDPQSVESALRYITENCKAPKIITNKIRLIKIAVEFGKAVKNKDMEPRLAHAKSFIESRENFLKNGNSF